jgi:hypothetical protein
VVSNLAVKSGALPLGGLRAKQMRAVLRLPARYSVDVELDCVRSFQTSSQIWLSGSWT